MRNRLKDLLICPHCKEPFQVKALLKGGDDRVIEGLLISKCGRVYPIVNAIPRILPKALDERIEFIKKYEGQIGSYLSRCHNPTRARHRGDEMMEKTKKSFGYQWSNFSEMLDVFKDDFLNYIYPVDEDFFKGKLGLDAGCGMGRHLYYASEFGANMVGIDFSDSIDVAYQNTKQNPNIDLVQCDIYNLPFRPSTFDFVYSIGVLHHLPDPEKGFQNLCRATKSYIFIWVYSKSRAIVNLLLEQIRRVSIRIPHSVLKKICLLLGLFEWWFFIQPYKLMRRLPSLKKVVDKMTFRRIKLYSRYPFFLCHADWFDRLSAPMRFYYDRADLENWPRRADLKNVTISPTGLYGWRLYGEKR